MWVVKWFSGDTQDERDTDTDLWDESPDNAEPPEFESQEDCSQDIAEAAGENVANNILNGVTWHNANYDQDIKFVQPVPVYSPEVPELFLILFNTNWEFPTTSRPSSMRRAARKP